LNFMKALAAALVSFAAVTLAACDRGNPPPVVPPAPVPVAAASSLLTSAEVDALVRAEWTRTGVAPTPPATDAVWLRRAWLDVLGTIPPPEAVRRFLAAGSPGSADKRARAIDELLASPLWSDHWTTYWDDVWMGRDARRPDIDPGAFRAWLHGAFERNAPWNEVVTQLLTATGRNSAGGPKNEAQSNEGNAAPPADVNGAVNWTLKYQENPQDMAGAASRTLLGVQIQCAQCHDHKTEKWTQADFQGFAAAFLRTRLEPVDKGMGMNPRAVKRVEVSDLDRPAPRFSKKMTDLDAVAKARPVALDGTDLGAGKGVRIAFARWVTAANNPWFSRALVNRMWAHFLGRGFVDPVDDLRPSNRPAAPEMFDALAADFVASGFDLKHLVRIIVGSTVYASSAAPMTDAIAKSDPEAKLWERFRVTPLGPDELLNALIAATRLDAVVRETGRLDLAEIRFRVKQRYGFLFDVDEESDERDYEGTIAQALALLNGSVVGTGASVLPGSALADVAASPGDDAPKIETLYLRTLSRLPTADEVARWTAFVQDAPDGPAPERPPRPSPRPDGGAPPPAPSQPDPLRGLENRAGNQRAGRRVRAYEDMLWALLNSSEFVLNH
jgi:hypothetical protein